MSMKSHEIQQTLVDIELELYSLDTINETCDVDFSEDMLDEFLQSYERPRFQADVKHPETEKIVYAVGNIEFVKFLKEGAVWIKAVRHLDKRYH